MKRKEATSSLPDVGISQVLGLVSHLSSVGGKEDIYRLAGELSMELGETLKVIRAAETLKLVNTPGGEVEMEPFGAKVVDASIHERKELIFEQLQQIPLFKKIREFLDEEDGHEASKEMVLEKIADILPNEDAEHQFGAIVSWGRYAELFGYNDDSETFYLDQ